ncbi:YdjY domain-containing protein [Bremerella cremea]|uniref:YdjY domain-containing protein n=1 Tax=Bremerella cremea TaxID=1031537 RepID=UPI0031E94B3C
MDMTCRTNRNVCGFLLAFLLLGCLPGAAIWAQDGDEKSETAQPAEPTVEKENTEQPKGSIRKLMPNMPVWIDTKRKMVIMDGEICLRKGSLEMFACLRGTKEHESIVAVAADAYVVHAALLAVGAKQGKPVQFDPEYKAPSGEVVDVYVQWKDADGKLMTRRAQDWVRDERTQKMMSYDWVFPGSYFWKDVTIEAVQKAREEGIDPDTLPGKMVYAAEGGELICVSNFKSSMLDVPVQSTDANNNLWFKAYTENIPAEGTKVRLFLVPNAQKTKRGPQTPESEKKDGEGKPAADPANPMLELPDFSIETEE